MAAPVLKPGAATAHDHDHAHDDHHDDHAHPERPWQILSAVLFIALLVVAFRKNPRAPRSP
jgi:hypothetical protein